MLNLVRTLALFGVLALTSSAVTAEEVGGAGAVAFSPAETLMWLTDHLANVDRPSKLHYQFTKRGTLEENFDDSVDLYIVDIHDDGLKDAEIEFFSGDRKQFVPPQLNMRGNPVLGNRAWHRRAVGDEPLAHELFARATRSGAA